jgi:hypothetical protein
MLSKYTYTKALNNSVDELDRIYNRDQMRGLEDIIHKNLSHILTENGYAIINEMKLTELGGKNFWQDDGQPRVDIVIENNGYYGIELKVIRMPSKYHESNSQRLWDIGQISSDYWRIKNAKKIKSGELGILLCGPLVKDLESPLYIAREFHNRMFLDFMISKAWGELTNKTMKKNGMLVQRKAQIEVMKEMGFDVPFCKLNPEWSVSVVKGYAYISIPIK